MSIVTKLKGIDWLRRQVRRAKIHRDYFLDAAFMNRHFLDAGPTVSRQEYKLMLLVHSIEKGLSSRSPRPFGLSKIQSMITLLADEQLVRRESTAYHMGVSVLGSWVDFHDLHSFPSSETLETARALIEGSAKTGGKAIARAGAVSIAGRVANRWEDLPIADFLTSRHSTRRYSCERIEDGAIEECVELAMTSPSACNRQMVNFHVVDSPAKKRVLYDFLHGTGGIDYDTCRLGLVTYDAQGLEFYGERNQGYLNAGLFAMTLVYAFHWRGIGSCLLQFGNSFSEERQLARLLGLPQSERIAVGLSFGSLESDDVVPVSVRRDSSEVLSFR